MASTLSRLASQSVHIATNPVPRSLGESKLVLAALQKFGEVVTFRNLKYDTTNSSSNHNRAMLAIFESPDSATQAINASPISIPIPETEVGVLQTTTTTTASTSNDASHNTTPSPSSSSSSTRPATPSSSPPTSLTCTIQPSHHNHTSALRRNPYHTTFTVEAGTYYYRDLMKTGIPLRELADGVMAKKGYAHARERRRIQSENERLGAGSLMALYREGVLAEEAASVEAEGGESGEKTGET